MRKFRIVLGSGSKYRAEQLLDLGLEFAQISPDVDEDAYKHEITDPIVLALMLSDVKAESVRQKLLKMPDFSEDTVYLLIASDQLVEIEGEILGKPGSREKAIEQLLMLSGNEHNLITALTMLKISGDKVEKKQDAVIERIQMHDLTRAEVENYVSSENPVDCAGSYQIEGRGLALFSNILGEDFTSIKGLPMLKVVQYLREFGFPFFTKD
ncbi:MAG: Maf family protein [Planctomycetes bacterium]|nr:Maf family protein [Planctomycetota bacterium]